MRTLHLGLVQKNETVLYWGPKRPITAGTPLANLVPVKAEAWNKTDPIYRQASQKEGERWGKTFFVWFVIGLFETLICTIAEDKVCDNCIVSSWVLLIFLLCDDQIQISCTISHFLTTRPTVGCWLVKKISTLTGYLLTDGLNYLTVKYLAGWHLEKRAAVLKLVSFPIYLGCYAFHYGIMYTSILYTLYTQILCKCLLSHFCHAKRKCFKQDFLHWLIQKLAKIDQYFKE